MKKNIGDVPVLAIETLAIRHALRQAIPNDDDYSKVIIESNSLIAIQAINGKTILPKDICTLIEDIIILATRLRIYIYVL